MGEYRAADFLKTLPELQRVLDQQEAKEDKAKNMIRTIMKTTKTPIGERTLSDRAADTVYNQNPSPHLPMIAPPSMEAIKKYVEELIHTSTDLEDFWNRVAGYVKDIDRFYPVEVHLEDHTTVHGPVGETEFRRKAVIKIRSLIPGVKWAHHHSHHPVTGEWQTVTLEPLMNGLGSKPRPLVLDSLLTEEFDFS